MMDDGAAAVFAAMGSGDTELFERLLRARPAVTAARDGDGVSLLMRAVYAMDARSVAAVRGAGMPLDVFEAAALAQMDRIAAILAVDPGSAMAWSSDGFMALHFAAFFGGADAARILLDAGAAPGAVARNATRLPPLHSAAAGQRGVAALLVARGADVNLRQQGDFTALHAAAQNGDRELVMLLLDAGADPAALSAGGKTPADLVGAGGHDELAAMLKAAVPAATHG